jgi:hypothetical protein
LDATIEELRSQFTYLHDQFQGGAIVSTFKLLTRTDAMITSGLDELQQDLKARAEQQSKLSICELVCCLIHYMMSAEMESVLAGNLPRVLDTSYDSAHICIAGTRSVLLKNIFEWSLNDSANPVLWLNAQAGAGKSTIAHTIAFHADQAGQLGACFFLHQDYADRRNPSLVITTLAFHLAHWNGQIADLCCP